MAVKKIPEGYSTVTPYLVVGDAAKLLDFVKAAFDAKELMRFAEPNGRISHAEVMIGDSHLMMGSSPAPGSETKAMLHLYVDDCDAWYKRAIAAGAKSEREPADQFYGDRTGGVRDPFGNFWYMATHIEDVSEAEMKRRMAAK